ncbi:MAG TPA: hypothetical protein VJ969_07495 [Desulfopila sp.]|nr:hypothetical protein [Desulfopila sp.]
MEYGYIFTALVVAIGVCHLVWRAIGVIGEHMGYKVNEQYHKVGCAPRKRADWYVFFSPSDLTQTAGKSAISEKRTTTRKDETTQVVGRRSNRNRPRVHANK